MLREGITDSVGSCRQCTGRIRRNGGIYHGFYDRFIGSIHNLAFGNLKEKKTALRYLIKLGIGWAVGMIPCGSDPFRSV